MNWARLHLGEIIIGVIIYLAIIQIYLRFLGIGRKDIRDAVRAQDEFEKWRNLK